MPCERKHVEAIRDIVLEWPGPTRPCPVCDNNRALTRALTEALAACDESPWRPIETAPKDGTNILLCGGANVSQGGWLTGAMQGAEDESCAGWWAVGCIENPTHWMPMPAAPEVVK